MRIFTLFAVIFFAVIFFQCCKKNETELIILNTDYVLKGERIIQIEPDMDLEKMFIKDSLLILISRFEPFFHIYNKNTYEKLISFGYKGRSGDEFILPSVLLSETTIFNDSLLEVFDINQSSRKTINLKNILKSHSIVNSINSSHLPDYLIYSTDLHNNSKYLVGRNLTASTSSFFIHNLEEDKTTHVDYSPHFNIDPLFKNYFYSCNITTYPKQQTIIQAYIFIDYINIYDLNGDLLKSYRFSDTPLPEIDPNSHSFKTSPVMYNNRLYSTFDYCYIYRINDKTPAHAPGNIIQMDWQGNIKKTYQIKQFINSFCVDERKKELLALVFDEAGSHIEKYNLIQDEL